MPITRETLLRLARDTVARQVRRDRSIMGAYLCGSVLEDEFLLGGVTDIDLVFLHVGIPDSVREIKSLSEDVHLDIAHHSQREYRQPRQLRMDPWLGPTLAACTVLYDSGHFLDFTIASVRGQFDRSDRVVGRAQCRLEEARRIAKDYLTVSAPVAPADVLAYLGAIERAANAVAGLSGPPLTERRLLLRFQERAQAIGRPGLYAGLMGLIGAPNLVDDTLITWLPAWQAAYCAISPDAAPPAMHPARWPYYSRPVEILLEDAVAPASLWIMLLNWTRAVSLLPPEAVECVVWREVVSVLGLHDEAFPERIQALDAYLNLIEETIESWADDRGVWDL
jgi:hypothetical protein